MYAKLAEPGVVTDHCAPGEGADFGLLEIDGDTFDSGFNRKPFTIRHRLSDHPLFDLRNLIEVSKRLPEEDVEYNSGILPVSLDPHLTPRTGLSLDETIRRIEECHSWIALRHVEQVPEYAELVDRCIDEVELFAEQMVPQTYKRAGWIFIASPQSVTPYHLDPEYNFLLQIRGNKTMNIFDASDRSILSEQELERYYSGGHVNLKFKEEYQKKAYVVDLSPGMGVHVPVNAPHWLKNGDGVSISFSITFESPESERRGIIYNVNAHLRKRGINPAPFGRSNLRDSIKYNGFRAFRRTKKLFGFPESEREAGRV